MLTSGIGPQTRALIMHLIKCFTINEEYNISMDYGDPTQAVCYNQAQLGWKHFLQVKLLPEWHDIINNEQQELNLPPNLHAVPQMIRALITMSLNN